MGRDLGDVAVTIKDFLDCDWKRIIEQSEREGNFGVWQALSKAADAAVDEELLQRAKCLWLLADANSMMLVPEKACNPFQPAIVLVDRRSAVPTDFRETELRIFAEFIEHVDHPWIKSRLGDLCWMLLKPRDIKFALVAIDAYTQISLDLESWQSGGDNCWQRAVSLALMLRQGSGDRLKEIELSIWTAFDRAKEDEGSMTLWLAQLLGRNGFCKANANELAVRLRLIAETRFDRGNLHDAREYFAEAARWYDDPEEFAQVILRLAEAWEAEADAQIERKDGGCIAAAGFIEKAIQTLRRIPRAQRDHANVEQRVARLREKLSSAGQAALGEMRIISSEPFDISDMISTAIDLVQGKSATDALAAFVSLSRGAQTDQLCEQAEKKLKRFSLQSFFAATHFSRDGRVVAKLPSLRSNAEDPEGYKIALWAEMIRFYRMQIGLKVQGSILPAIEILRLEHRLHLRDFVVIAERSSLVSVERANLLGRGLSAGYDGDFVVAIHVLVPQIEEFVRWHLKESGTKTTTIDSNGIETENGLGTLLELPSAVDIFGKDLVFELKALLCDPLGPNLRNELAHGLLGEEECFSSYAIYLWWLVLKITFGPYWNSLHKAEWDYSTLVEEGRALLHLPFSFLRLSPPAAALPPPPALPALSRSHPTQYKHR